MQNTTLKNITGTILLFGGLLFASCGDFSDPCDDLVSEVCDECNGDYCSQWKALQSDGNLDQDYCLAKLENFRDEIAPFCNEE